MNFTVLAVKLEQEELAVSVSPIPFHARNHTGGFYCCWSCGKLFMDVASIRRHQAQYCRFYRESERIMSTTWLLGG